MDNSTSDFQEVQTVTQYKIQSHPQVFSTLRQAMNFNFRQVAELRFRPLFHLLCHTTGNGEKVFELPELTEFVCQHREEIEQLYRDFDAWSENQVENKP